MRTRQRILETAAKCFAQGGRDFVGIREIASEADVSLPTVMYHFKSKDTLYQETALFVLQQGVDASLFEDFKDVDVSDPSVMAACIQGMIGDIFAAFTNEDLLHLSDFLVQGLFTNDRAIQKGMMEAFVGFEEGFLDLLTRAGIPFDRRDVMYWLYLLWSQVLFYSSAQDLVKIDLDVDELPEDHFDDLAMRLTRTMCHELGIPVPQDGGLCEAKTG